VTENKNEIADDLRERALRDNLTKLECAACSEDAWVSDPDMIAKLVEHCVFDHGQRQGIIGVKCVDFISAYVLSDRLGAAPTSDHEVMWRHEQTAEHPTVSGEW
jgi:hypothetical protein